MTINVYRETFLFLTNLAYNSRFALPVLLLCGFLLLNVRISVELSMDTDHVNEDEFIPFDLDGNDTDGSEFTLDDYSSENESSSSVGNSENSHTLRTLICLDVEIDHFYPVNA